MGDKETIFLRAQLTDCLATRIAQNVGSQEVDLVNWIFDRLKVTNGSSILELCCGTGEQTIRLLELVGEKGEVVALDISPDSLQRLASRLDEGRLSRLTAVQSSMEDLGSALEKTHLRAPRFDMVFCAYGLYYSSDANNVLAQTKERLKAGGRIVVIGPFGPNNRPLFDLLERSGVEIPTAVRYTSQDFMEAKIAPWATRNFQTVRIHTLVNRIRWANPDQVLSYWKSSTFFEANRLESVQGRLNDHFRHSGEFVNEKWVMLLEMADARA